MHGLHGSVYFHGYGGKWLAKVTTLKVRALMQRLKFDLLYLSPTEAIFSFTKDRALEAAGIIGLGRGLREFRCLLKKS